MDRILEWIEKPSHYKKIVMGAQYILGIIVIGVVIKWIKGVELVPVSLWYGLAAVCSIILMRMINIMRLHTFLENVMHVEWKKMIRAQLLGISLGLVTPGKMGESYKVLALGSGKEDKKKLTLIFLFEKIMDTSAYVILGMTFAIIAQKYIIETIVLLGLLIIGVFIYSKLNAYFSMKIKKFFSWEILTLSFFHFIAFVTSFWFVVKGAGIDLSFLETSSIITLASVISILSTLPGGLGAREATGTYLLSNAASIDLGFAGNVMFLHLFINYGTTWLITAIVYGATGILSRKERKKFSLSGNKVP